jgi:3-deoxy-D-arabino-heptulosonate 7-phosphate (DAHP) synthase class II
LIDTNYAQYVELEQSKTRVEALTAVLRELEDAVRAVLRTDIWICDSPFHGPTLTFNGTTKTQVWDNLAAALATSEQARTEEGA